MCADTKEGVVHPQELGAAIRNYFSAPSHQNVSFCYEDCHNNKFKAEYIYIYILYYIAILHYNMVAPNAIYVYLYIWR